MFQLIYPPAFFRSLSKFLRRSLMIFIIKGFQTIVFISIISLTFRPICTPAFFRCLLSKFLRRSLMIFIIKGFRTIVFIFIVISIKFQPICPPASFGCLSNSQNFELRPLLNPRGSPVLIPLGITMDEWCWNRKWKFRHFSWSRIYWNDFWSWSKVYVNI